MKRFRLLLVLLLVGCGSMDFKSPNRFWGKNCYEHKETKVLACFNEDYIFWCPTDLSPTYCEWKKIERPDVWVKR